MHTFLKKATESPYSAKTVSYGDVVDSIPGLSRYSIKMDDSNGVNAVIDEQARFWPISQVLSGSELEYIGLSMPCSICDSI